MAMVATTSAEDLKWQPWHTTVLSAAKSAADLSQECNPTVTAYALESTRKLFEDRARSTLIQESAMPWQSRATEPRGQGSEQRLEADIASRRLHSSLAPLVEQVLSRLGCSATSASGFGMRLISAPRVPGTAGSEVALVSLPSGDTIMVKVGCKDKLAREAEQMRWVARVVGPYCVPRMLLETTEVRFGLAALPLELVEFARAAEHRLSSLADLLLLGTASFAIEDVRSSFSSAPLSMPAEFPASVDLEAAPPSISQVQSVAQQVAKVIGTLTRQQPTRNAAGMKGPSELLLALFDLIPVLERHILQAHSATTSPLHASVRHMTEQWYESFFGGDNDTLRQVLDYATKLKARLCELESATNRGDTVFPRIVVPLVCSHGHFTAHHALLRNEGDADSTLQLCMTSWSGLSGSPIYSDLASLLTSITFETARLPLLLDDISALYSATAEAGAAVAASSLGHHLRVTTPTASRLLYSLCGRPNLGPNSENPNGLEKELGHRQSELLSVIKDAAQSVDSIAGPTASSDMAWLIAALRCDEASVASAVVEARKISQALCDWTLPPKVARARSTPKAKAAPRLGVPRLAPPPSRRQRGDVPVRAMQWGWRTVREFRDAAVDGLPVVEGDIAELWPALWLVPSLKCSLELLESPSLPWPQKVWLLFHIGRLIEKLSGWLESFTANTSAKMMMVRIIPD